MVETALTNQPPAAPSAQVGPKERYQLLVDRMTTQVIAAMPLTVPDEDLKRARARFRVAFSSDAQGALMECTPDSIARCIVLSAMSGLYPGGPKPDVYLIPRRNKHKGNALEAQWQMSFRGYIRLARRAGWELEPVLVFDGEEFKVEEGDKPSITHVRNLDLPKTWDTVRYGYIRVYPVGKRDQARIAYLTKAEIKQRRAKAQDQNIWNEWPLEMVYKTLCNYAGNREMFPTDDPTRYATQASEQAEIGTGGSTESWEALPAGSKTSNLAARLAAPPAEAAVIDVSAARPIEGMPLDLGQQEEPEQEVAAAGPARPDLPDDAVGTLRFRLTGGGVAEELLARVLDPRPGETQTRGPKGALTLDAVEGAEGETVEALVLRANAELDKLLAPKGTGKLDFDAKGGKKP